MRGSSKLSRLQYTCASPGCRFRVHSAPEIGGFCCIACSEGGEHGPRCEKVEAPPHFPKADSSWEAMDGAALERLELERALRVSAQEAALGQLTIAQAGPLQRAGASTTTKGYPDGLQGRESTSDVRHVLVGDLLETVGVVLVRQGEDMDSKLLQKLEKGSVVEVIQEARGRRVRVRDTNGQEGWVSLTKATGELLLQRRVRNCLTGIKPTVAMPAQAIDENVMMKGKSSELGEKLFPRDATAIINGGWYECLGAQTMRQGEDLNSMCVREVPAGSAVQILEAGEGPRCKVQDSLGLSGWVSVAKTNGEQLLLPILSIVEPNLPDRLKIGQSVFWSRFSCGQEYDDMYGVEGEVVGEAQDSTLRDRFVHVSFPWGSQDVEAKWLAHEFQAYLPGAEDTVSRSLEIQVRGWTCAHCNWRNAISDAVCTSCGFHWQTPAPTPHRDGRSSETPGHGEDAAPRDWEASARASKSSPDQEQLVVAKTKTAAKTGSLSLCDCGLHNPPAEIFHSHMAKLRFVDMSRNLIRSLPETIRTWKSLKTMNCSNNRLQDLPQSISALTKLQKLVLANNILVVLPSCLVSLESLKELTLCGNRLGPRLFQPGHEEEFHFAKPLSNSLEILDLSHNAMQVLPQSLLEVESLRTLRLGSNALTTLPDSLNSLSRVTTLDVANNQLCHVNDLVSNLPRLSELVLTGNPVNITELERSDAYEQCTRRGLKVKF